MTNFTGQDIGRYRIIEPLGQGGMATVYRGFDTRLDCDVAVKFIRMDQVTPAEVERTLKRFEREAKEVARLTHPNIVKVTDYGEYKGTPYLVMVYLPGGTLKQLAGEPLPYDQAARLMAPVARALEYAHEKNLIHRDIKPGNILLTDRGQPMVSDFGIAKILGLEAGNTLTSTNVAIGTPEYMAPEQWFNQISAKSDIYSLGVVFYELVTGRKPYTADTPAAIFLKQSNDPLPRPRSFVPGLPEEVENVLYKALAKKPEERYASMDEFAAALEGLAGLGKSAQPQAQVFETVSGRLETPAAAPKPLEPAVFQTEETGPGKPASPLEGVSEPPPADSGIIRVSLPEKTVLKSPKGKWIFVMVGLVVLVGLILYIGVINILLPRGLDSSSLQIPATITPAHSSTLTQSHESDFASLPSLTISPSATLIPTITLSPTEVYTPTPIPTPLGGGVLGKIAFLSQKGASTSLNIMQADGTGKKELLVLTGIFTSLSWSPDGKWIGIYGGNGKSKIIDVNDPQASPELAGLDTADSISWSPDSQQFAFSQGGKIYTSRKDGADLVYLTEKADPIKSFENTPDIEGYSTQYIYELSGSFMCNSPIWSEDGKNLFYECEYKHSFLRGEGWFVDTGAYVGYEKVYEVLFYIKSINIENPDQSEILGTSTGSIILGQINLSQDGTKFVYARTDNTIWRYDVNSKSPLKLAQGKQPIWSKDEKSILFTQKNPTNSDICSMPPDGENVACLTNGPGDNTDPIWSPDGHLIAFVSIQSKNQQIFIMNADGTNKINLTNDSVDDFAPAWAP